MNSGHGWMLRCGGAGRLLAAWLCASAPAFGQAPAVPRAELRPQVARVGEAVAIALRRSDGEPWTPALQDRAGAGAPHVVTPDGAARPLLAAGAGWQFVPAASGVHVLTWDSPSGVELRVPFHVVEAISRPLLFAVYAPLGALLLWLLWVRRGPTAASAGQQAGDSPSPALGAAAERPKGAS